MQLGKPSGPSEAQSAASKPIAHACFVLDRVRMAGPSYAGLGSGSGLVGEGSSELGSELQNCWVAFEHAGDGGCFFGEPSASSSSGSVSELVVWADKAAIVGVLVDHALCDFGAHLELGVDRGQVVGVLPADANGRNQ